MCFDSVTEKALELLWGWTTAAEGVEEQRKGRRTEKRVAGVAVEEEAVVPAVREAVVEVEVVMISVEEGAAAVVWEAAEAVETTAAAAEGRAALSAMKEGATATAEKTAVAAS